ncbi:MAG TPA: hypothetical protein VMU54_25515 [Planctomycetota bacterium]|nr:hypothetical protein [Planctomycetota bacterium]
MRRLLAVLMFLASAFRPGSGRADDPPAWTQVKPGEFPPAGAAREISGELIGLDHVNRSGLLRPDRNDSQRTDDYDIALPFSLLPYAKILFHGSYAELRDVPLGTHLHGLFFVQDAPAKNQKPVFNRALALEDDFSRLARLKRSWRVETVEADKGRLVVTGLGADGPPDAKPVTFQVGPATRVWKGRGFGKLADVAPGQQILANLTVCTLKGPGRCTDLWIDDESRSVVREQQLEAHRLWQREHGLGCWVDAVDNRAGTVTVTLFDAADPSLLKELRVKEQVAAAVAEESLRTYDQNNDVRRGPVLEVKSLPPVPGSSGIQVTFKPNPLLEGYRPGRCLRLFAGGWRIDDLPKEERLYR